MENKVRDQKGSPTAPLAACDVRPDGGHEKPKSARGRRPDPQLRESVLKAAAHAFMERGFAGTSIDDVAQFLGVTKGSVYHHYRSKADLYRAVQESAIERFEEAVRPIFESDLAPQAKLHAMTRAHAITLMRDFEFAKVGLQAVEMLSTASGVEERRELRRKQRRRKDYEVMFLSTVQAGAERGVFSNESPGLVAKVVLGAVNWLTLWYDPRLKKASDQMEDLAEQLARIVVRAAGRPSDDRGRSDR